jgi:serine/threonine-protein kinase
MTTLRPPPVSEGQVVAGKYRVERVLGTGGMGVVVAAHHIQLDQRVALKFLHREAMGSRESVNRFLREGQVLARLKSPNVARVMDVGTLDQGVPYLVMEYLQGADLGAVLQERSQLPVPEAVGYVLQACEAIAEAHAAGIVHRDLKPSNLFLTQGPDGLPLVKVLDFGISKATAVQQPLAEVEGSVTATGSLVGSPLYMSPEQIRNPKKVDVRTDIWSVGVILYELLSGITPFEGETLSGALAAIVADAPAPIRTLRPDVPAEIEEVLKRCLHKDANGRFSSIAELAHALGDFVTAESRGSVMRIARVLGVVMPQPAPTPPRAGDRDHGRRREIGHRARVGRKPGAFAAQNPARARRHGGGPRRGRRVLRVRALVRDGGAARFRRDLAALRRARPGTYRAGDTTLHGGDRGRRRFGFDRSGSARRERRRLGRAGRERHHRPATEAPSITRREAGTPQAQEPGGHGRWHVGSEVARASGSSRRAR